MKFTGNTAKNYFMISLGSLIMALSLNLFLVPNKIAAGGASGIATILYINFKIPVSLTVLLINALLFTVGFKKSSKKSLFRATVGTALLSVFIEVTSHLRPVTDDLFLASLFGGILMGVGIGIVILSGASTGGTDFAAQLLNSIFPSVSIGKFILMTDLAIILISGVAFGDYTILLYEVMSLYISTKLTDNMIEGVDFAKSAYIISDKYEDISKALLENLGRGVTGIYGRGLYKDRNLMMLLCIVKRHELPKLRKIVIDIDPKSFIILSEVREVLGEGFK